MLNRLKQYHHRYLGNYHDRTMLFSVGSLATNAVIGVAKLGTGIFLFSPWFISTGIYYLLLCAARMQILRRFRDTKDMEDRRLRFDKQFYIYKRSGIFICLIGVSYFGVCLFMYFYKISTTYPFYILYGVAAVAFYKITMAIYGIVVTKKMKNPLLSTMKIISLVDACVSIVAVQCALIAIDDPAAASASSALFGMGCSAVFLGIGIVMLCKRKKYPAENEFDIKNIVKKKHVARKRRGLLLTLKRNIVRMPAETESQRLSDQITREILSALQQQDDSAPYAFAVTLESWSVHIFTASAALSDAALEESARGVIVSLAGQSKAARYQICVFRKISI